MSPEQARGEILDSRTDLFSLGAVLYEMATGRQAFAGNTSAVIFEAILNRDPLLASHVNPIVPLELEQIISKALEKDRGLRYHTAGELRADLKRLRRDRQSGRVSGMDDVPPKKATWRRVATYGAIAVVALAVLSALFLLLNQR